MIHYEEYRFSRGEWIYYGIQWLLYSIVIGWLFYHSIFAIILISGLFVFYARYKKREQKKKRKEELNVQFKEGIQAITAALTAGYSIENAFVEAYKDLNKIYPKEALIVQEFSYMVIKMNMNVTVESLLMDFAKRRIYKALQRYLSQPREAEGTFIALYEQLCKV